MRRQTLTSDTAGVRMTTKRFTVGLLMGALLFSASSAFADDRTEAKSHFKKGMQAIADGKYEEGISELQRAYEIRPHPNVLYNIARAYAESGDLEGAVANYQKYLDGNPPDKEEVSQVMTALQSRMERQKLIQAASQQAAPTTPSANPGLTPPGTTPGTTTPGTTPAAPTAVAQTPGGPSSVAPAPQAGVNVGAAKTEDVFEESVVTASKGAQSPLDAPNSTSIITEQDIHLSGIIKIPELLRRLAGVDIMEQTGAQTDVSLRGFNQRLSNKVLVLIDGRSVFVDLTASTFWETLPIGVEDIERIEVVRGPGSALYGADAFNGVINIITKAPGEGKSGFTVGYGDHNTAHGTATATGRDKGTAYRMSAGFDNIPRWDRDVGNDRVDTQLASQGGFVDQNTAQKSVRLFANITQDLGSGVTAGVGGGYVNSTFNMGGFNAYQDVDLNADITDVTAFLSSKHFDVHAFFNRFRGEFSLNDNYIGQSLGYSSYNVDIADIEAQYIDDRQWKDASNNLHVGLGYRYRYADWAYLDTTHQENFEAAYLHDELKLGKRWAAVGDLRGDYVPYLGKIIGSPKASILFHPSAQSTIRGIVATAFRVPSLFESYLSIPLQLPLAGANAEILPAGTPGGNSTKVKAEQVVSEELGYLNSESDFFTFDSAIFHNYVSNLIDLSPIHGTTVGDLSNGEVPSGYNQQTGTYPAFFGGFENQCQRYNVYGGEFGVRAFPTEGLDLYANYTAMAVKEDLAGCTPEQQAGIQTDARTSGSKLNAGVQVRTKIGIDGSVDFHYISPQDWAEQVTNISTQSFEYQKFHLPAYTLLNARIGYRFFKNHAEISGVAFNILDDKHREHPFGNVVGSRFMGLFSYHF